MASAAQGGGPFKTLHLRLSYVLFFNTRHALLPSLSRLPTQASGQAPAALQAKLPGFLKDAEAFVSEGMEAADVAEQPRQQTLGELLLGLRLHIGL